VIDVVLALCGIVILSVVSLDFLYTAIGAAPFSPVSDRVAHLAWRVLRYGVPESKIKHRLSGPFVMTAIAVSWIVLVSVGWTLLFQLSPSAVLITDTETPANFVQDFAFVGHLLSTLGGGPFETESPLWLVLSVVAGVNGMVILTLSVSFVLSTTMTVSSGRALLLKAAMFGPDDPELRANVLPALADLVANLNSMQFALYYSAVHPNQRLPAGLVRLAEQLRGHPDNMRRLRIALSPLPGFEGDTMTQATDAAFIDHLKNWSQSYTL